MTMNEWWAEYENNAEVSPDNYAGKLTHGDVNELLAWIDEDKAKNDGGARA